MKHFRNDIAADDPAGWANVRCFRALVDPDVSASWQRAIDNRSEAPLRPSYLQGGHSPLFVGIPNILGE